MSAPDRHKPDTADLSPGEWPPRFALSREKILKSKEGYTIMTATADQGDEMKSPEIRKRGVELDKMYQERFPDTDEVFDIADSEGYIACPVQPPDMFRHYTDIAKLWTAQGYLAKCGPLTRPKLEALIQGDMPQPEKRQSIAEIAFENFCHRAPGYECQEVNEGSGKTPDYTISIGNQKCIVEVKELGRKHDGGTVGAIVREKIRTGNRQLKTRTKGRYPGMTVLYDRFTQSPSIGPLGIDHIRAAMYGVHTLRVPVPKGPAEPSRVVSEWAGKDRTTTLEKNTTTSAVCVLRLDSQLLVYHNCFAAIPIDPSVMAFDGVHQFRISDDMLKWLLIE